MPFGLSFAEPTTSTFARLSCVWADGMSHEATRRANTKSGTARSWPNATSEPTSATASGKRDAGPETGRSVPARELQQPVVSLRLSVAETSPPTGEIDANSRPSHQHIVYFLEDEEILRKVRSMSPLLTESVRSRGSLLTSKNKKSLYFWIPALKFQCCQKL